MCRSPGYLIHVSPGKVTHRQLGQGDPASSAKLIISGSGKLIIATPSVAEETPEVG